MTRYLLLSFTLLVFLSGCTVSPSVEETKPRDSRPERIATLLNRASIAYEGNRLTTPPEDNAYLWYSQVLALEVDNSDALEGLNLLVEKYLSWAIENTDKGKYNRARQYARKAASIDPDHPNIIPVTNRITDAEARIVIAFDLDPVSVQRRKEAYLPLDLIALRISQKKAFVTIRAPDDETGRWLYQMLNSRVDFRIEARFERRPAPSVILTFDRR